MNELFKTLAEQLKGAGAGSKAVAAMVGVAVVAAIGFAAVVSNHPHMEILRSGLQDYELSAVGGALGTAGIPFETSQPPGPFTVFVDAGDRYRAFAEIYKAGALDKPLPGIVSDGGVSGVFDSSTQRTLKSWKKRWEEMELTLTTLDFVHGAKVSTSLPNGSSIGRLRDESLTASVTLQTRGGYVSEEQRTCVASVVCRGLGIKRENVVVVDEKGNILFDGSAETEREAGGSLRDLADFEERWELTQAEKINEDLVKLLGPNKALVSLDAVWDIDQSLTRSDTTKKGEVVSRSESTTETPITTNEVGGPAGFQSNMPDPTDLAGSGGASSTASPAPVIAKTSDTEEKYVPGRESTEKVNNKYVLSKLSIALWVDESVPDPDSIRNFVANALGYDETRDPEFVAQVGPINVPDPAEAEPEAEDPESGLAVFLERYLQRGVEIVVALVFVILLLKSLKGARTATQARASARTAAAAAAETEIDPELLARAQVEELLRADPDRVGEILSAWARDEAGTAGVKA